MKPYLVDVPVCIFLWTRTKLIKKTFEPICIARPRILFLASDGGRTEEEWKAIRECRAYVESRIDWDCTIYRIYEKVNNGVYHFGRIVNKYVFDRVDRCTFQEDDILADPSFYSFCCEMLERYKDDLRISQITGQNLMGIKDDVEADYFFSNISDLWGWATWRRTDEQMWNQRWMNEPYVWKNISRQGPRGFDRGVEQYRTCLMADGHIMGDEFAANAVNLLQHQLTIVPKKNLTSDMGADAKGEHIIEYKKMDKVTRSRFNTPVYKIEDSLVHPYYVVEDVEYRKYFENIVRPAKWKKKWRHMVTLIRRIYYGDIKQILLSFLKMK